MTAPGVLSAEVECRAAVASSDRDRMIAGEGATMVAAEWVVLDGEMVREALAVDPERLFRVAA